MLLHPMVIAMTSSSETFPLLELIDFMKHGGKIAHYEWEINEYITINNGYFVDEEGLDFTFSPWSVGEYFHKLEE